jgi:hypothetical protein
VERAGPGLARLVGLPRLRVRHAERVGELDVVGCKGTDFFEVRDRFGEVAGKIVGESEHLHGFAPFGRIAFQPCDRSRERLDGAGRIVRVVKGDAEQLGHARVAAGVELLQLLDGGARLSSVDQRPRVRERRADGRGLLRRGGR